MMQMKEDVNEKKELYIPGSEQNNFSMNPFHMVNEHKNLTNHSSSDTEVIHLDIDGPKVVEIKADLSQSFHKEGPVTIRIALNFTPNIATSPQSKEKCDKSTQTSADEQQPQVSVNKSWENIFRWKEMNTVYQQSESIVDNNDVYTNLDEKTATNKWEQKSQQTGENVEFNKMNLIQSEDAVCKYRKIEASNNSIAANNYSTCVEKTMENKQKGAITKRSEKSKGTADATSYSEGVKETKKDRQKVVVSKHRVEEVKENRRSSYDGEKKTQPCKKQENNFGENQKYSGNNVKTGHNITSHGKNMLVDKLENVDEEYKSVKEAKCTKGIIIEKHQNLFDMSPEYSLAHCVAEDMRMFNGISANFKKYFNSIDILLNQRQKQGGLAVLKVKQGTSKRYIYNLVVKRVSNETSSYDTLRSSLTKMRDHICANKVKKLAIPRLGCGLNGLKWDRVKRMIDLLFNGLDVEIVVCNFEEISRLPKLNNKLIHVNKSIANIEPETIIIYLSTENGHVSKVMKQLDKKFNFLSDFNLTDKRVGDLIKYEKEPNILYGCIVKKSVEDPFDWIYFSKCISQINENNKKDLYEYVAMQVITDKNDDFINEKIVTVLRNYLEYVDIYICWNG